MLAARGSLRSLFNTSGTDYRKLGLAGKLSKMSPEEAFALLAENRDLVKRPYVSGDGINLTGFDETEWKAAFA
jgi:arsenate reductase-like glutaredoxin family protein